MGLYYGVRKKINMFLGGKMKRLQLILIAVVAMMFLVNCGASKPASNDMPTHEAATNPVTPLDLPDWYINPPEDDDTYVYSTATGNSRQMQVAVDKAKQAGMVGLSQGISATVQSMVKQFTQESGMGENTQLMEFYQSTSRTITDNTLNGVRVLKKYPYQKPGGGYTVYVLLGLRKDIIAEQVVSAIKNEEALYTEFKATQAFQEMEAQIGTK
jgi:hypothetical protein